jgi:hypothetical protein
MESPKPELPEISETERTPLVGVLLELLAWQQQRIDALEQALLKLKGETTKPKIKPSKLEAEKKAEDAAPPKKGPQHSKKGQLKIAETITVEPAEIPEGSRFKGYREVVIQDIVFETHTICYRLAQYETREGRVVSGQLPDEAKGCGFGKHLIQFILYQYHHQHVTQPLLLEQLHAIGIDISSGRLSQFITAGLDAFHDEKDQLLPTGLSVSAYVHTDDTLARHDGQSGYCTHIGNDLFAWFKSTESKSRINFLSCLGQGKAPCYAINAGALEYLARHALSPALLTRLEALPVRIHEASVWEQWLDDQAIETPHHRKLVTEGALMGGLLAQGVPVDLAIISDDAGQFNVFDHALCWIHAERVINRLIPLNEGHVKAVEGIREQFWSLYHDLKDYRLNPLPEPAATIRQRFHAMCDTKTCYETLNQALKRMGRNQHELLRVLDKPYLPLHNNLSERDIRDYVKKRKISGSTRSEQGRKCRDTFASLKKTCRKLGISFWDYLKDRLLGMGKIPPLSALICAAATRA